MKSLWYNEVSMPEFPSLRGDTKTDVLIIGGGIAGLLTAYFLQNKGVRYLLVEKDRICGGISGNTTAKITFQHGLIYHKILRSSGTEAAQMYLAANKAAAEEYAALCQNIDCDYEPKDNYVYSRDNRKRIEDELYALDKIGFKVELREDLPLPIPTAGAVCFKAQAQFHPLKFLAAISKKLNICEDTKVLSYEPKKVVTNKGNIFAEKIIVTTHFPFINTHGSYFLKLYQHRSYVLALKGADALDGMYVDDDKKGLSFRSYGDILLLGGGGHKTGKTGGSFNELRRFWEEHYKNADEVARFAAQDCMSLDDIPYIGNYSRRTSDMFVASGFNKWGMTSAMAAAMILSDEVLGIKSKFSPVFDPSRSILKPQLLINGVNAVVNIANPLAKRCPHLGCALKWNKQERSWDCPCHGSRFSEDGKVLDNPANGNLKI